MNNEILTIQHLYERINWTTKSRVAFRSLLNMVNGYEPTTTDLIPNRFERYWDFLNETQTQLRSVQIFLDTLNEKDSNYYQDQYNLDNVQIYYLQANNEVRNQTYRLSQAINDYSNKILEIQQYPKETLKGRLDF